MPSTCRNRGNERVVVTDGLADQTRAHWLAWPMTREVTAQIMPTIQQS
jgi:hypothetical protein